MFLYSNILERAKSRLKGLKTRNRMKLKYFKLREFECKCGCKTNKIDDDKLL